MMNYKTFNIGLILVLSITSMLYSCNRNDKKLENSKNYKESIIGTWQEINSKQPGFRMTDSTIVILDTVLFSGQFKYNITKDTLSIEYSENSPSKSKIILLTNDSLILSDKGPFKVFKKIK